MEIFLSVKDFIVMKHGTSVETGKIVLVVMGLVFSLIAKNQTGMKSVYQNLFIGKELLCRPTDKSVSVCAVASQDVDAYFEYGIAPGVYTKQTPVQSVVADSSIQGVLTDLQKDTKYFYRMQYRLKGATDFTAGSEHTFHTCRPASGTFTFTVQADPHLDDVSDTNVYKNCMKNVLKDNPDFNIDLGDIFMSEKLTTDNAGTIARVQLLRSYYDLISHSMPVFLVLGNHEGEAGNKNTGIENWVGVWDARARKIYFPNPQPDDFYTGDTAQYQFIGKRESYYAWEWGSALFVVIDPFWYSKKNSEWGWTLGETQYWWFRKILETSIATFKFVFAHQLVGGLANPNNAGGMGRGGAEAVQFFEMGGKNADSTEGFATNRPGWGKTIHQVLVDNKVAIYFHGHDHFYAKQQRDGVIYQECPQPSLPNYTNINNAAKFGYVTGKILPNAGHVRVTVSPTKAFVEYVRAYQEDNPANGWINGTASDTYTIVGTSGVIPNNAARFPGHFGLRAMAQRFPSRSVMVSFQPARAGDLSIDIYDVKGTTVRSLIRGYYAAGTYSVVWNGTDNNGRSVVSGVYMARMRMGSVDKCILLTYRN